MTDSPRSRFRLPHWGWFLLATILLAVGFVGLSVLLPWHREQQLIQTIASWGGKTTIEVGGPDWLREFVGHDRMKEFRVFERVHCVILSERAITDAEIAYVSGFTNIKKLYLSETTATDVGMAHLSRLTNLRILAVDGNPLTDAGLAYLSGLSDLSLLHLNDTAVTDAGLVHLSGLTKLHWLRLTGTSVTDKGIEAIQKALPECHID